MEHRVSLFADDLLLCISDPAVLLLPALALFSYFGNFSGHKMNVCKSEFFPINKKARALDLTSFGFKVKCKKFTYLGVTVTRNFKDLFKENFAVLTIKD